jgi:uncharacterized protein YndB with AHSA1/START domain
MSRRNNSIPPELGHFPSPDSFVLERVLPGPIELVWDYLTEPTRLPLWLAGAAIEAKLGGAIDLDFDLIQCPGRENMHGTMSGVITAFEPPRLFAYSWNEGGASVDPESTVTFELIPFGKTETTLILTHTRIRHEELSGIAAGWHVHVYVLEHRISNTELPHFGRAWAALDPEYRKLVRGEESELET